MGVGYLKSNAVRSRERLTMQRTNAIDRDMEIMTQLGLLIIDEIGNIPIERNPLSGLQIPKERNPTRAILSEEDFQKLLTVAAQVDPLFDPLLRVTHAAGHRLSAVLRLRWADVNLETKLVKWSETYDKSRTAHDTPLTEEAIASFEKARRLRSRLGDGWVFPSAKIAGKPMRREYALDLWNRAEKIAGVPHVRGRCFHSLRRKFATVYAHIPLIQLQLLGGWKDHDTILKCYQQPNQESLRAALETRPDRVLKVV
jgi:integrase